MPAGPDAGVPAGGPARWRRPGFGLPGPRRPRHVLDARRLAGVGLPVGDDGVVVGEDARGRPAVLGLVRPSPLEVVLVGGLWLARVLALRAAAAGARVAVETARPREWAALAAPAGAGRPCVTLHEVGRVPPSAPSVADPVLVLRDAGGRPPGGRLPAAPWQSVLTLLPFVGPAAPRLLEGAAVVGVQRVSPDEARLVARAMALPAADADALPALGDAFALWCTRTDRQWVTTRPSGAETGLLGEPRRMD